MYEKNLCPRFGDWASRCDVWRRNQSCGGSKGACPATNPPPKIPFERRQILAWAASQERSYVAGVSQTVHLEIGTVETRAGQHGPGGSLGLLGDSRVANNIRGFFATRIGSALPDTGWRESLLSLPKKWLSGTSLVPPSSTTASTEELPLPKLPVPELEQTMNKYEYTMRPLLNTEEQRKLKNLIEKFAGPGGLGTQLQLYLQDRREKMDNWAYDYWLDDMYLKNPSSLPVNSNPGMVFPPRKFTTILDVARFTARLLDAALDHKTYLDKKQLPVELATSREPGQPLCMAQYYRILGTCRIPGRKKDAQVVPGKSESEHVIVICRSQLYCVPVQAPDRGRLSEDEICAQLLHILDDAPCLASPPPVGLLTAWKRPLWAEARENLMGSERNRRNLDLIQRSLLVVCLDEGLGSGFNCRLQRGGKGHSAGHRDETNLAVQMIHGGGSTCDTANRWFDKTIQLIVSGDGACGLCYEHSQAEGIAVIQLVEKLWKHADSQPATSEVPSASISHLPPPERLEWTLDDKDFSRIEEAALSIDNLVKDLDFQVFRYTNYGKDFIKSCKVSPDVYIQLALQLAYYRLYGKLTATYESASTRRFRLGRVDCIRSASPEALAWAMAMAQPKDEDDSKKVTFHLVSDEEKLRLWKEAIKRQTTEMVDNILGQGIDIHLLGLREAARETSPTAAHPLPDIFTDYTYKLANKFLLSTSQVATSTDSFMGYGPVEPDGYGASYNPKPDHIIFCLSAFWSSEVTSTSRFAQSLDESLNLMQALLTRPAT
nr:PREDICTED: choline O-acetyltransferase [Tribolium castaneum]|eukprot:XP_008201281.1 PREDICTED: choline O-acetyltransferase [Tribolium castaneum]